MRNKFMSFLLLTFGLAFGISAISVEPSLSVKGRDYSDVFYKFGFSLFLLGTVFSDNFKSFLKSSSKLFAKSDSAPEYDESNPPIQKAEGMGEGTDLETKLDNLKNALDSGEVEMTEESIRAWCSSNGVSDEDSDYIISVLMDTNTDIVKSEMATPPENQEDPEFEKSFLKYLKGMENKVLATEKRLNDFQKSQKLTETKLVKKDEEIQFLKSELAKYAKQPIDPKSTIKEASPVVSQNRPQIIATIKKGMSTGHTSIDDLLAYEAKGILPANFNLIN